MSKLMRNPERWLKLLLFFWGFPPVLALIAFVMPFSWMASVHEWLGLGTLPNKPIVDYLARYASAMSALYGLFILVLMTDVRRYARLITLQSVCVIVFVAIGAVFACRAGMPAWWIVADVFSCWTCCGAMLWLQRKIPATK